MDNYRQISPSCLDFHPVTCSNPRWAPRSQSLVLFMQPAFRQAYGESASIASVARRDDWKQQLWFTAGTLVFAATLLPLIFAVLVYGERFPTAFIPSSGSNVYLNTAATALVMVWSLQLNGRFDRKLTGVINRVLLVHGGLAFWVLVTRQVHSNQMMLIAGAASALLGPIVMTLRHRAVEIHAALIGDWHPLANDVRVPCDWVQSPAADLGRYDLLLTASVVDLSPEWAASLSRAMLIGKPVRHLAEFVEEDRGLVCLEHFDLEHIPAAGLVSYRLRKRLMDIGLVLLALPVALPILAVAAVMLVITMGRPILFVQPRAGLGGKVFNMYKLRTMRAPPLAGEARATSSLADDRITPLGRWLRRFRIDELPQLWNVLKGDMSVIGPRPEWTLLSDQYIKQLPVYAYRQMVRPGITGWAQVMGGYAADMAETRTKVGYDLFYIKNLSFSLDVQILVRTVWTLVSGSGAR